MNVVSRRRVRHLVPLAAAVIGMASVAGCGSSDDDAATTTAGTATEAAGKAASGEKVRIAFFGLSADNTYTQSMYEQAKADGAGMNAEVQFFDGKWDGATQAKQVQDAVTSGRFDGLIIMPNDAPGLMPIAQQAIEKGIAVSALEYPLGSDPASTEPQLEGITTQVIEDVIVGAETVAEQTNLACEKYDPCKVGMLWGSRKLPTDAVKVPVFKEKLAEGNKLVAEADAQYLTADGRKVAADFMQAHPDINVLVTVGDQMAIGAQQAVEQAGKKLGNEPGAITIVGYGATDKGVDAVREGKWLATYALVPKDMASKAIELTVKGARGEPIADDERSIVQTGLNPIGTVVTKETLEQHPDFVGQYTG